jgi:hypothetical protein
MAVLVSLDELYRIWMTPEAVSLTIDEARGVKAVTLQDGTTYEARL